MMTLDTPFECSDFSVDGLSLSFLDSEGTKPPLHFSHANGFPVSMYLPWMAELARDFRVIGLSLRGQDGLSEGITDWHTLAMDLAGFLESRELGPLVGVGHSIGAVTTLLCAARRPDLFSRVILLDPPLFPKKLVYMFRWAKLLGQKRRFPPAVRARRRRDGWKDRQEALDYFRGKGMFNGWKEEYLRAYVTYGLRPDPELGMALICPPEAEARGFENYPTDVWSWPPRLRTPTLLVRGGESEVLTAATCEYFCRLCPQAETAVIEGAGHFIPMQRPDGSIRLIKDFSAAGNQDPP
jgi:pimeloyl-ACP methyl ester carboxylesterase